MSMIMNGYHERIRMSRQDIKRLIDEEVSVDKRADMAFSRLHEYLSGQTILNDQFAFDFDGVGYVIYLDKSVDKVFLGCSMEFRNKPVVASI